jgi:hypothetical protein
MPVIRHRAKKGYNPENNEPLFERNSLATNAGDGRNL